MANYSDITLSPRVLKVQLENLHVTCDSIGRISKLLNHECKVQNRKITPSKNPVGVQDVMCHVDESNESNSKSQSPSDAAKLLKGVILLW